MILTKKMELDPKFDQVMKNFDLHIFAEIWLGDSITSPGFGAYAGYNSGGIKVYEDYDGRGMGCGCYCDAYIDFLEGTKEIITPEGFRVRTWEEEFLVVHFIPWAEAWPYIRQIPAELKALYEQEYDTLMGMWDLNENMDQWYLGYLREHEYH